MSAYKQIGVLAEILPAEDKQNIAALILDNKYHSLMKLMTNIKAQLIQRVVHKKLDSDEEMISRGGVMVLQMLQEAVISHFKERKQDQADELAKKEVMDGLGW